MQTLELGVLNAIQGLRTPLGDALMPAVSALGHSGWFWIVVGAVMLLFKKTRQCGCAVLLGLLMATLLGNSLIKPLVQRTRPYDVVPDFALLVARETSFSFPSGHTITAFAAATAIAVTITTGSGLRWLGWSAFALAVLIGFSRLYLYVHFPTDVLAGAVLGSGCGWCAARLARLGAQWIERKGDKRRLSA